MTKSFDLVRYNQELLLSLRMEAGVGTLAYDYGKPHHVATLTGVPVWTNLANDLTVLNFNPANPDYLVTAAAGCVDLDFTTGDFSGACWVRGDALGNRNIMTHGVHNTDGWYWTIGVTGDMSLYTSQAAAFQVSTGAPGDIVIGTWRFVSFSRDGAVVTMYTNGEDVTTVAGTHVDPATAAARNFYIGVNDAAGAAWYDGDLWNPRVWNRAVPASEFRSIFERERALFYV